MFSLKTFWLGFDLKTLIRTSVNVIMTNTDFGDLLPPKEAGQPGYSTGKQRVCLVLDSHVDWNW